MDDNIAFDKPAYIYKLTSPNGKVYIGQTKQKPQYRWAKHESLSEDPDIPQCPALGNAIRLYKWENFTKEVLCECMTQKELNNKETEYILQFNSLSPNGYNLTLGGDVRTVSDETRLKMRDAAINKSKRVYKRKNPELGLPRGIQRWRNSYRIDVMIDGKHHYETFNISKLGSEEVALRNAKERLLQLRPQHANMII